MKNDLIETFFAETTAQFQFLKEKYGYNLTEKTVRNEDFFPDSEAVVKYSSPGIAVEIFWYFASAVIGIAFIKLENGRTPKNPDIINLYALANHVSNGTEKMFLLKDTLNANISKIKLRENIINDNMKGVIQNIASGVNKYAINIVQGDASIFKNSRQIAGI